MSQEFEHPLIAKNDTNRVQNIVFLTPITTEPFIGISQIAKGAGVEYGIAKKTLESMDCVEIIRTGGPTKHRQEEEPKTVYKTFNAVDEREYEGNIPLKCVDCPYSNAKQRTAQRNRPTSGCTILGFRRLKLEMKG
jgi:hypothetical protein